MSRQSSASRLQKFLQRYNFSWNRKLVIPLLLSLGLILVLVVNLIINQNRVHELTIAAGSRQGESYALSSAIAQVVAKHEPKIKIKVIDTEGSEENINKLEQNQAQLATAQADIRVSPSARLVSNLYADKFQIVVTAKSGIKQVADLKGKRIALPPVGSGQYQSFLLLAAHYRLASTDFVYKGMSESEADAAFRNNQIDAIFRVRPPGNKSIQQLVQNYGGQLVAIDQAAAMKINQPAFAPAVIPKGAYQGNPPIPATDLPTVSVQRNLLANKQVDEDIIRQITSILYEYRQDLATGIPLASEISPPDTVGGTSIPLHPGAASYYDREKPNFIQEHADYVGLMLTVVLLLGSWAWQFKSWLEKTQKNRGDDYNKDIVELIRKIEACPDLNTLEALREKLYMKFERVVEALDKDKITPDSFQSFTFTWEAAMSAIRDRRNWLTVQNPMQKQIQPRP